LADSRASLSLSSFAYVSLIEAWSSSVSVSPCSAAYFSTAVFSSSRTALVHSSTSLSFFFFVFFDLFSFLFEHSLIILNHCVVVYSVWVLFELLDLVFANLLVTLDGQCIENFHCFGLSLLLKRLQECVSCSSLFISDLLLFKLTLLTGCLCLLLLELVKSILLSLVCELLLDCCHFLLLLLHLIDFFIKLLLDFHEDTLSLGLAVGGGLDHALEYLTQLIAKREQVLSDLSLWVESHRALSVVGVIVDGSMHKTFSIAFVEQLFNLCD
jgi:hypothetical protein